MQSEKISRTDILDIFEQHFSGFGSQGLGDEVALNEVFEYHNKTGGNRTRAKLALECANNAGLSRQTVIHLAKACECLHQASLLHDDVMDDDSLRRGKQSVWSKFGTPSAICLGDELIAQAFAELAGIHSDNLPVLPQLLALTRDAIAASSAGQVYDCSLHGRSGVSLEAYEKASSQKSGPLLALPLSLTMCVMNESEERFNCLSDVASAFGTAYQLLDDLEDADDDKDAQLNGYWVIREMVASEEAALELIEQRYDWYRRVITRGLNCLPSYALPAVKFFYKALQNKANKVGLTNV